MGVLDEQLLQLDEQPSKKLAGTDVQFNVHLDDFEGPFETLLSMISKRKLDITNISLSHVTDEFMEYVKQLTKERERLDEISEFILIAAILLDLKAARLLPGSEDITPEDLDLLEARDLLFAKLLQYKAYKDIAVKFAQRFEVCGQSIPRQIPLPHDFAAVLPELAWTTTSKQLAAYAAAAFFTQQIANAGVSLEHIHMRQVSVVEQGVRICSILKKQGVVSFRQLISDTNEPVVVVSRFLSLLELYKMNAVSFEQKKALEELTIKWIAADSWDFKQQFSASDFDNLKYIGDSK
ncbi:MAG: segregation/condensation protein A [Candidatus Ancillula trichonymphae]|jgi:segregation and condensation protein A|nr:segregation/condensation protein A [Candidatus Ancillula trichonymphae]